MKKLGKVKKHVPGEFHLRVILMQIRQAIGEFLSPLSPLYFIQTLELIKHLVFETSNVALYTGALHSFWGFQKEVCQWQSMEMTLSWQK